MCGMLGGASSREYKQREGEGTLVRQGHLVALVVAFLIGCAVVLVAGASGVQAEASKKEQARCEGTRTIKKYGESGATNDVPGCPKGGLLLGTDKSDWLAGKRGDDEIRGLGARDEIYGSGGSDVIYGGSGDDKMLCGGDLHRCGGLNPRPNGGPAEDVMYGGDGNDLLKAVNRQRDKLYCGKGTDKYVADSSDYVSSSCEKDVSPDSSPAPINPCKPGAPLSTTGQCHQGPDFVPVSASASPTPVPLGGTGGPAILLPAAALLLGSGILTYAILRRR
jgi:hypothetical protein